MKDKKHKIKIPKGYEVESVESYNPYDNEGNRWKETCVKFKPIEKQSNKILELIPEIKREMFYEFEIAEGHKFKMNDQLFEFVSAFYAHGGNKVKIRAKKIESR